VVASDANISTSSNLDICNFILNSFGEKIAERSGSTPSLKHIITLPFNFFQVVGAKISFDVAY
jgi:hypothetical protein